MVLTPERELSTSLLLLHFFVKVKGADVHLDAYNRKQVEP
jgi:hypothetical protein